MQLESFHHYYYDYCYDSFLTLHPACPLQDMGSYSHSHSLTREPFAITFLSLLKF